jgi:hypothetical protein
MSREPSLSSWSAAGLNEVTSAWGELAADLADAYETFLGAVTPETPTERRAGRHRTADRRVRSGCSKCGSKRCGGCRSESCHCTCCVYDADLVVHARLGELRVVPVRISNERSRTRNITLQLSEFTSSGGREVPIRGAILTRTEFELESCAHEDATILVQAAQAPLSLEQRREEGRLEDVDDCVVGYADLRIQGCDIRPVRIAVALLPRDCDAYEARCSCGCC